jgi:hypothetical protein
VKLTLSVMSESKNPGVYEPVIIGNELGTLLAILFDVSPCAYLYVSPVVNVRIKKSPGGLNEVGFLTLDTVRVNGVSELIGTVAGSVILIVV